MTTHIIFQITARVSGASTEKLKRWERKKSRARESIRDCIDSVKPRVNLVKFLLRKQFLIAHFFENLLYKILVFYSIVLCEQEFYTRVYVVVYT